MKLNNFFAAIQRYTFVKYRPYINIYKLVLNMFAETDIKEKTVS